MQQLNMRFSQFFAPFLADETRVASDCSEEIAPAERSEPSGLRSVVHRVYLLLSVLIVLAAFSLRIYHISQRSLWLDEAIAANISRGTLSETLTLTRGLHSAPIVHPFILNAVERFGRGPLAARMPSLMASVLAVVLMLCFVTIPSIDFRTAGLSALMLSVSAPQIRYAQEVREYSLGVLYAGVLLYVYLSYCSKAEEGDSPIPLYVALFIAPFVQYGLVLFSFGLLSALLVLALTGREPGRRIRRLITASGFLALGGLLSFMLTLRYQWGEEASYLQSYYWTPGSNVLRFVELNTHHLITFLLPGLAAAAISMVAALIYLVESVRARIVPPLSLLAFCSCGVVLVCSILHLYPYGGIRQCLFLAPVLCLFASASLVQVANRFTSFANSLLFVAITGVVVVSGVFQIRLLKPYAEVEDIQKILLSLRSHLEPGDGVYVYCGAVPAVDFYVKERDRRFMYGNVHQQDPEKYVSEMLAGLGPDANRLWLVFSHIHGDEDQRILHDLSKDWKVEQVLSVKGSAKVDFALSEKGSVLYLASRRFPVADEARAPSYDAVIGPSESAPVPDLTRDSFWDWNMRISRQPAH